MLKFRRNRRDGHFADRGENEYSMQIEGSKTSRFVGRRPARAQKSVRRVRPSTTLSRWTWRIESEEAGVLVLPATPRTGPAHARGRVHEAPRVCRHQVVLLRRGVQQACPPQQCDVGAGRRPTLPTARAPSSRSRTTRPSVGCTSACTGPEAPAKQKLVGELNYYFDVKTWASASTATRSVTWWPGSLLPGHVAAGAQVCSVSAGGALREPEIRLAHGDLYIMSHKAIGSDCAKKNIVCWRHARRRRASIRSSTPSTRRAASSSPRWWPRRRQKGCERQQAETCE